MNKAELFQKAGEKTRKVTPVELPEIGTVYVRPVTTKQAVAYSKRARDVQAGKGEEIDLFVMAILTSVCDEHGQPLFEPSDVDQIKEMGFETVNRLAEAAIAVSGMKADDQKNG